MRIKLIKNNQVIIKNFKKKNDQKYKKTRLINY